MADELGAGDWGPEAYGKHQITSIKSQTNSNYQIRMFEAVIGISDLMLVWNLMLGAFLNVGAWNL
jgi:hypothetical protein